MFNEFHLSILLVTVLNLLLVYLFFPRKRIKNTEEQQNRINDLIQLIKLNHDKTSYKNYIIVKFKDGEPRLELRPSNSWWYLSIAGKNYFLSTEESKDLWEFINKEREEELDRKIKERLNK